MSPEEKLANKLLTRHFLSPPYDLKKLVLIYADLEYESFPFTADGITIGVKAQRPTIYINKQLSPTRSKFTLAHELGHIKIPWHIGTIVSDIDRYTPQDHYSYREKEAEANRFAAELLMPSSWINGILHKDCNFQTKLEEIINSSGASLESALIKVMSNCIENRYLLIMNGSFCEKQYKGQVTKHYNYENSPFDFRNVYSGCQLENFVISGRSITTFIIGNIDKSQFHQNDPRPWKEILNNILDETILPGDDRKKVQLRVNAILSPTFQSSKSRSFDEICSAIRLAYDNRPPQIMRVVNHILFPIYIKKRVEELLKRN